MQVPKQLQEEQEGQQLEEAQEEEPVAEQEEDPALEKLNTGPTAIQDPNVPVC